MLRPPWLRLAIALLTLALLPGARAATSPSPVPRPDPLASDPRLDKPVTLHGLGVPVKELLGRMAKATGARMSCTEEVGELKVVVGLDSVEARKVLLALSSLFGLNVRVSQVGAASAARPRGGYRLVRSQANRELEARLRDQDMAVFRRRMDVWRQWGHVGEDQFGKFVDQHREALERVQYRSVGGGTSSHRVGLFMEGLSDQQVAALYRGERVTRAFSALPESVRGVVTSYALGWVGRCFRQPDLDPGPPPRITYPPEEGGVSLGMPTSTLAKATVTLWTDLGLSEVDRAMYGRIGGLDLTEASAAGRIATNLQHRRSLDFFFGGRGLEGDTREFPGPRRGKVEVPDPSGIRDPDMDIDLGVLAPFLVQGDRQRTSRVLWQIHRISRVPLLADYHARMGEVFFQSFGNTLGGAIASLQGLRACTWRKVEGIHTFRDTTWYLDDATEVPADTLRGWLRQARESKAYSVGLRGEIMQLTDSQLMQLTRYGLLPGLAWYPNSDHEAAMRLWGSMTEVQRVAVLGEGLDMRSLTPGQLEALDGAERIDPTQPGVLHAKAEQGRVTFTFPDRWHREGLQRAIGPAPFPESQERHDAWGRDLEWAEKHPEMPKDGAVPTPPSGQGPDLDSMLDEMLKNLPTQAAPAK